MCRFVCEYHRKQTEGLDTTWSTNKEMLLLPPLSCFFFLNLNSKQQTNTNTASGFLVGALATADALCPTGMWCFTCSGFLFRRQSFAWLTAWEESVRLKRKKTFNQPNTWRKWNCADKDFHSLSYFKREHQYLLISFPFLRVCFLFCCVIFLKKEETSPLSLTYLVFIFQGLSISILLPLTQFC